MNLQQFQRKHMKEYEQYLAVKRSGVPQLLIPIQDGEYAL